MRLAVNRIPIPSLRLSNFYFWYFAVIGAFMPYWTLYLQHRGLDKATIGLLAFISVFTRIIAPSAWGWLADRRGRRMQLVRFATAAEVLAWASLWWLPSTLPYLVGMLFFYSFFQNAILAQFEAVTLFWLKHQRQRYGAIRLWGSAGFIASVLLLGVVFDHLSVAFLPAILAALSLVSFGVALACPEPPLAPQATRRPPSVWPILQRPTVYRFFAMQALLLLSHAPFYSFYSLYLGELGYSVSQTGVLWTVGVVAEIVMFMNSRHFLLRWSERQLFAVCLVVTGVRWILTGVGHDYFSLLLIAQCAHAFSFALFQVLSMQLINREFLPEQQGRAQGLFSMVWGLGVAAGSWLCGRYWDTLGGNAVFVVAGMVSFLAVAVIPANAHTVKKP